MKRLLGALLILATLQGCGLREPMSAEDTETPTLTPRASTYYDPVSYTHL